MKSATKGIAVILVGIASGMAALLWAGRQIPVGENIQRQQESIQSIYKEFEGSQDQEKTIKSMLNVTANSFAILHKLNFDLENLKYMVYAKIKEPLNASPLNDEIKLQLAAVQDLYKNYDSQNVAATIQGILKLMETYGEIVQKMQDEIKNLSSVVNPPAKKQTNGPNSEESKENGA